MLCNLCRIPFHHYGNKICFNSFINVDILTFQNLAGIWNHDGDILDALQMNKQVARFRQTLKDNPSFLQDKVRQYFKVMNHKSRSEQSEKNIKQYTSLLSYMLLP